MRCRGVSRRTPQNAAKPRQAAKVSQNRRGLVILTYLSRCEPECQRPAIDLFRSAGACTNAGQCPILGLEAKPAAELVKDGFIGKQGSLTVDHFLFVIQPALDDGLITDPIQFGCLPR